MKPKEMVSRLVTIDVTYRKVAKMEEPCTELCMFVADYVGMPMDNTFLYFDRYGKDAVKEDDFFSREFVIELFDKHYNGELEHNEVVDMLLNWREYPHNTKGGIYFNYNKYFDELSD
jgi:hypothetical protein